MPKRKASKQEIVETKATAQEITEIKATTAVDMITRQSKDISQEILSYLNVKERMQLATVCKKFNYEVNNENFWQAQVKYFYPDEYKNLIDLDGVQWKEQFLILIKAVDNEIEARIQKYKQEGSRGILIGHKDKIKFSRYLRELLATNLFEKEKFHKRFEALLPLMWTDDILGQAEKSNNAALIKDICNINSSYNQDIIDSQTLAIKFHSIDVVEDKLERQIKKTGWNFCDRADWERNAELRERYVNTAIIANRIDVLDLLKNKFGQVYFAVHLLTAISNKHKEAILFILPLVINQLTPTNKLRVFIHAAENCSEELFTMLLEYPNFFPYMKYSHHDIFSYFSLSKIKHSDTLQLIIDERFARLSTPQLKSKFKQDLIQGLYDTALKGKAEHIKVLINSLRKIEIPSAFLLYVTKTLQLLIKNNYFNAFESVLDDFFKDNLHNGVADEKMIASPTIYKTTLYILFETAVKKQNGRIIEILLKKGLKFNIHDNLTIKALEIAASQNNYEICQAFLTELKISRLSESQKNEYLISIDSLALFELACKHGNSKMVNSLLEMSVPFNKKLDRINPFLADAVIHNRVGIVEVLLNHIFPPSLSHKEKSAYAAIKNEESTSLVSIVFFNSCSYSFFPVLKMFVDKGISFIQIDGVSTLYLAAMRGNVKLFQFLLEHVFGFYSMTPAQQSALLNERHSDKRYNVFHAALAYQHHELAEYLYSLKRINLNQKSADGSTPLYLAAERDFSDNFILKLVREKNAKLDVVVEGYTPLSWVVQKKSFKFIQKLIRIAEARNLTLNLNAGGLEQKAALQLAVKRASMNIVKLLVEAGANHEIRDSNENTLLHLKHDNARLTEYLIELGLDVAAMNAHGEGVFYHFVKNMRPEWSKGGRRVAREILELGGLNETEREDKDTALHASASKGWLAMCDELFSRADLMPVDVNAQGTAGMTPLHCAIKSGSLGNVVQLLRYGAKVDVIARDGSTAFHFAAVNANVGINIVKSLIKNLRTRNVMLLESHQVAIPQFLNKKRGDGATALHLAVISGAKHIVKHLLYHGANVNLKWNMRLLSAIELAAKTGAEQQIIRSLLHAKPNIDDCNNALYYAAESGNTHVISALLTKKEITPDYNYHHGKTPLHIAVEKGYLAALEELLTKPCDVNCRTRSGKTPLFTAVEEMEFKLIPPLIKAGADINLPNRVAVTPLMFCAMYRNETSMVEELLNLGADPNLTDRNNMTAAMLAAQRGNLNVLLFLIGKQVNLNITDREGRNVLQLLRESEKTTRDENYAKCEEYLVKHFQVDEQLPSSSSSLSSSSPSSLITHNLFGKRSNESKLEENKESGPKKPKMVALSISYK